MIKRLDTSATDFTTSLQSLLSSSDEPDQTVVETVSKIINDIRARGDNALLEYTNRFDQRNAVVEDLVISPSSLERAFNQIPAELRTELQNAADRIRAYHDKQLQQRLWGLIYLHEELPQVHCPVYTF